MNLFGKSDHNADNNNLFDKASNEAGKNDSDKAGKDAIDAIMKEESAQSLFAKVS